MENTRAWAIQSFTACILLNAVLGCLIYLMADKIIEGLSEWILPLSRSAPAVPDEVRTILSGMGVFLDRLEKWLAPALAAVTGAVTLLLWLSVYLIGRRRINRIACKKTDAAETSPTYKDDEDSNSAL